MRFSQFRTLVEQTVTGQQVVESVTCYDHVIQKTADQSIMIDREPTNFKSLDEARDYIKQLKIREELEVEIQQEQYAEISNNKIADVIRQYHGNTKITDTLIESYVELASSKLFTADPVANTIRNMNKLDRLIESHIDYKLDDGSVIVISEDVQSRLNNTFAEHLDVVEYMRSSKENFLSVLNQLED